MNGEIFIAAYAYGDTKKGREGDSSLLCPRVAGF